MTEQLLPPANIAVSTIPQDQISTGSAWNSFLFRSSGATYGKVPHILFNKRSRLLCRNTVAKPKSEILRVSKSKEKTDGTECKCFVNRYFKGASQVVQWQKNTPANARDSGSVPEQGRSLEEEMATHCSMLAWENPMDREAWHATVHGVAKSWV